MTYRPAAALAVALATALLAGASAHAQGAAVDHAQHAPDGDHGQHMPGMDHSAMPGMAHEGAGDEAHGATMAGFLGPYPMSREGSGTSWQPDASPHPGVALALGDWMLMGHALLDFVYDDQGGPRGETKAFVSGMAMAMAQRRLGDGTLGFKAMLSPDPFMGARGYPLLLAAGETANGHDTLVDRQHPHDLFIELSTSYSRNLSAATSAFGYFGLPGEPALGPSAFMHRASGGDIPEAPITHHWLDSTHISYGVLTGGVVLDTWKVELSTFRGREPDQHRYDIETPALDSIAARLSWNPTANWSAQVSWGYLKSPEQLDPDVDENRVTASATYTRPLGAGHLWSSTFAWGRKLLHPGNTLDGFLLESELILDDTWTLFGRAERVSEDELVAGVADHRAGPVFTVGKLSLGGIHDWHVADHLKLGVGGLVSKYAIPGELDRAYGSDPTSFMLFLRLKVS